MSANASISATRSNLRRLCTICGLVIVGLTLALAFLIRMDGPPLPLLPLSSTLAAFALVTLLSWWRSYWPWPITEIEFFIHLLLGLLLFSIVLYFSGGATNPLVSYYLVPISIAAATLPRHLIWALTLLSLAAYTLLMQVYVPMGALAPGVAQDLHHSEPVAWLDLHVLGMWLNFAVSAGFITYFVVRMAEAMRSREAQIQRHQEEERRTEQVLGIASLAAGTAHELSTPLNSIHILADELYEQVPADAELRSQLSSLRYAVNQCRDILHKLVAAAETSASGPWREVKLHGHLHHLLDLWRLTRPGTTFDALLNGPDNTIAQLHASVDQTLTNLVNNAVDASPERISITANWSATELRLNIRDFGAGLDPAMLERAGKTILTTKRHGLGIGLFLSKANLERLGGTIILSNVSGGGTLAEVVLPLTLRER